MTISDDMSNIARNKISASRAFWWGVNAGVFIGINTVLISWIIVSVTFRLLTGVEALEIVAKQ